MENKKTLPNDYTKNDINAASPIVGVFVELKSLFGATIGTAVTNAAGNFTFLVRPGVYKLRETTPERYAEAGDSDGGNPNQIEFVDVTAGDSLVNYFLDTPLMISL